MKTFLLIDDHFMVRAGIMGLLRELFKPCEIYETDNIESAVALLKQHSYSLIMMDIHIPKTDMLGMMDYIHIQYPQANVLIYSMSAENVYAKRFLKAGAKGFLPKDANIQETIKAMNLVINGRKYISETLGELLVDDSVNGSSSNPFDKLSVREFEIANLLLTGLHITEIAKSLNLQRSTVGTHKAKMLKKMAVANILQLKELALVYMPA